ncbi:MAG: gamma-glutamyl-gamma-aminobutyrate hydrolase family protein [Fusobacterium sp.]|uniref:gamma-glutamyl-gamma-aminobutyrate hydrolase family protein n=1 Tax=Fusobacterium sp. TaxID=68766 RepID=UPI0026DD17AD|nr:gamma-glutamyl-gamma-aminobutyrate hydrolase family protein [Fusobacterium sp.]MDO4690072.1 gamma-glutamyl-gamma-aminobutyrate hydrolase family protein [Fusobacterium sp.]
MKKPIIGITSAYELEKVLLNYHRTTLNIDYTKSIIEAGGIPLVLPVTNNRDVIAKQLSLLDGLILSGGADINPFLYGQDFKKNIGIVSPERDEYEIIILDEFLKTKKPILGICRGHQLLNVYFKGTLFQDIAYYERTILNHKQECYPDLATHNINIIDEENILFELFGKQVSVNSFHHQIIDKLGQGLTAIAQANDGVIEAIQMKNHKFLYGIQWHPEMMVVRGNKEMKRIFDKFLESCLK